MSGLWSGCICVEGVPTADRRLLLPGCIERREGSVPLLDFETRQPVGSIESVWRDDEDQSLVMASGQWFGDVTEPEATVAIELTGFGHPTEVDGVFVFAIGRIGAVVVGLPSPSWPDLTGITVWEVQR